MSKHESQTPPKRSFFVTLVACAGIANALLMLMVSAGNYAALGTGAVTLAVSLGMLVRKEWARKAGIAVCGLAMALALALFLVNLMREAPEEGRTLFYALRMYLGIPLALFFGFIAFKLSRPAIRSEFR